MRSKSLELKTEFRERTSKILSGSLFADKSKGNGQESQNHKITEQWELKGTSGDHLIQSHC